jgi:Tfp pilus assembly protein PilV
MDPDKQRRFRLRSERGSMLVEVMVGAVLLAIATTALLNGIDGAQSQGTTNKARSTASALAEQDQERLRAMPVASLASCCTPASRIVTVRGVDYTVTSTVSWVTDQGGPISCSNNSKTAANLRILSEVTSNATKGTVDEVGLVTPPPGTFSPGQGRAIVKVNDRNGAASANKSVSLIGTTTYTATTNSLGCAVFPFVNAADYTVSVGAGSLSLVDWQGTSPSTTSMTVTAGTSTSTSFEMDTSGEIRAVFDTQVAGTTAVVAKSQWLTLTNSKLTVGLKTFQGSPAGSPQLTVIAPTLFPFLDGYKAYAGQCSANNPALAPTSNSGLLPTYSLTPGQILTMTTANDIRVPSINVQVIKASDGSAVNGATVKITSADTGCTQTFPTQVTAAKTYGTTTYQAVLPEPGFPYGKYRFCAEATISTVQQHGYADVRSFGAWSDSGTSLLNEATNPAVNEVVSNTAAGGTPAPPPTTAVDGAVRIRMTRQGLCP